MLLECTEAIELQAEYSFKSFMFKPISESPALELQIRSFCGCTEYVIQLEFLIPLSSGS